MTLTRQLRHKARAERAAAAVRAREKRERQARHDAVKVLDLRVEVRYLHGEFPEHPVFTGTVVGWCDADNVIEIERDEPPEGQNWGRREKYHACWVFPDPEEA